MSERLHLRVSLWSRGRLCHRIDRQLPVSRLSKMVTKWSAEVADVVPADRHAHSIDAVIGWMRFCGGRLEFPMLSDQVTAAALWLASDGDASHIHRVRVPGARLIFDILEGQAGNGARLVIGYDDAHLQRVAG